MAIDSYQGKPPPVQAPGQTRSCDHSRQARWRFAPGNLEQHLEAVGAKGV